MIDVHGLFWLDPGHFFMLAGLASVVIPWLLWRFFARLRLAWIIENTPTSVVRSAAQGQVELSGFITVSSQRPLLLSPLTGRECLWYRYRIEEYRRRGKNNHWQVVEKGASEQPFLLRDHTGECWIDPRAADVHPRQTRRWEGTQRHPLTAAPAGLLSSLFSKRYRYTEELFVEGDLCYALGWFVTVGGGRSLPDIDGLTAEVVREWKADFPALLERFDRNRNGQLDETEWQQVRQQAAQEAARRRQLMAGEPDQHWLRKPPGRGLPFILSDHHEEHLSRKLRRQSLLSGLGLAVSVVVAGGLWLAWLRN